jgi:hypothetical protein
MKNIVSENSKNRIFNVGYRALKARRRKISARRLLLHKQHLFKIDMYEKKKK